MVTSKTPGEGRDILTVSANNLYDGVSLSWLTLLAGVVGITLAMLAGMPAMVRTRAWSSGDMNSPP